jgi:hypothetical protein
MNVRKIYVEEGELVEIRIVPKDEPKNAAAFQERLHPEHHRFLANIGTDYISLPTVSGSFCFEMDGHRWGPLSSKR